MLNQFAERKVGYSVRASHFNFLLLRKAQIIRLSQARVLDETDCKNLDLLRLGAAIEGARARTKNGMIAIKPRPWGTRAQIKA